MQLRSLYSNVQVTIKITYVAPTLVRVEVKGREKSYLPDKEDAKFVYRRICQTLSEIEKRQKALAAVP